MAAGNTCPLRGLPVGLQDTAVTTLTISNCTLEDVDLQNLGLIQQLESLQLSADFSRCARPMQVRRLKQCIGCTGEPCCRCWLHHDALPIACMSLACSPLGGFLL